MYNYTSFKTRFNICTYFCKKRLKIFNIILQFVKTVKLYLIDL